MGVIQRGHDSMLHWEGEADELSDLIHGRELSLNNDYPPTDHAVVDDDLPYYKAECRSDLLITLTAVAPRYDKWGKYFSTLCYRVGPYSNVFCLWPKGWPAPAPNRFGYLPKAQFASNPGSNEPKEGYPSSTTVRYKGITDGQWHTRTFTYP